MHATRRSTREEDQRWMDGMIDRVCLSRVHSVSDRGAERGQRASERANALGERNCVRACVAAIEEFEGVRSSPSPTPAPTGRPLRASVVVAGCRGPGLLQPFFSTDGRDGTRAKQPSRAARRCPHARPALGEGRGGKLAPSSVMFSKVTPLTAHCVLGHPASLPI